MVRRNLSWADATFRGPLGLVLGVGFMESLIVLEGSMRVWAAGTFGVRTGLMIGTASTGFCPIYRAFGRISVCEEHGWDE